MGADQTHGGVTLDEQEKAVIPTAVPEDGRATTTRRTGPDIVASVMRLHPGTVTPVVREGCLLALISIGAALIFYLPFMLQVPSFYGIPFAHQTMDRVYGMWDGPLWVTPAATLWDPNPANPYYAWIGGSPKNYAERFPLFPLAIRLVSPIFGYWKGALVVNVLASTGVTLFLYTFLRRFGTKEARETGFSLAFWIALVSIFWPPRGFLYRNVIMSEPVFILGLLGAVYYFKSSRFLMCGIFGAIAVASRPNSSLMIAVFGLLALARIAVASGWRQRWITAVRMTPLVLMPATLGAILVWHQHIYGDWLASVHSTTFVAPVAQLYPSLTYFGIGEEGVPYLFLLVLAGIIELIRRRNGGLALLSAAFYVPSLFVATDVVRYLLPILPFTFALAGERIIGSKPVRIALILSLPLIYTYAWTTLLNPGYQAPFGPLRTLLP